MQANGPECTTNSSNHFAKMRCISVGYMYLLEYSFIHKSLAELLNGILDQFPRAHCFTFYPDHWLGMSLDSTPEVIHNLRQRLNSIRFIFFEDDQDDEEFMDGLNNFLDAIRPQNEWRQQTCNEWPNIPTWRFHTLNVGENFRVWSIDKPGCGVEEL